MKTRQSVVRPPAIDDSVSIEEIRATGIQGKRERERKTGTGTFKNSCYSSDSLPVKFTELCKPSHKCLIVCLSHNKRRSAQNSILTNAICDLL